jgi:hypothetical protein
MSGDRTNGLGKEASERYGRIRQSKRALYSEFCGHPFIDGPLVLIGIRRLRAHKFR